MHVETQFYSSTQQMYTTVLVAVLSLYLTDEGILESFFKIYDDTTFTFLC